MCKLGLEEKIEILHMCLLGQRTQSEIAYEMGVKISLVTNLMRKAKANISFLQDQRSKEDKKQEL